MSQFPFGFNPQDFGGEFPGEFPFDPQKAGEIFSQLGNMMAGIGGALQNPVTGDPHERARELASKIALEKLPNPAPISAEEATAVNSALSLGNTWLDAATILPSKQTSAQAWTSTDWVNNTVDMWLKLCEPLSNRITAMWGEDASPEQQEVGKMISQFTTSINTYNMANQLGNALANVAQSSLTSCDIGLHLQEQLIPAVLPHNINALADSLEIPRQEFLVFIMVRESAHIRLHSYAPWLNSLFLHLLEQYANEITMDYSAIQDQLKNLSFESGVDTEQLQEALVENLQNMSPSPEQTKIIEQIQLILALIEGWVSVTTAQSVQDRLPHYGALEETLKRFRLDITGANQALVQLLGVELKPSLVNESAAMFRKLTDESIEVRDTIWKHLDLLPNHEEVANPELLIRRINGTSTPDSLDKELDNLLKNGKDDTDHPTED